MRSIAETLKVEEITKERGVYYALLHNEGETWIT